MPAPANTVVITQEVHEALSEQMFGREIPGGQRVHQAIAVMAEVKQHGRGLAVHIPIRDSQTAAYLATWARACSRAYSGPLAQALAIAAERFATKGQDLRRRKEALAQVTPGAKTIQTPGGPQTVKATPEDIKTLQDAGISVGEIARHLGVSHQTIYKQIGGK